MWMCLALKLQCLAYGISDCCFWMLQDKKLYSNWLVGLLVVDVVSYWLALSDVQLFMVNQFVRIIRSVIYGLSVMLHA